VVITLTTHDSHDAAVHDRGESRPPDVEAVTAYHRHMHETFRATESGAVVEFLGKTFVVHRNVFWPGDDSKALVMNYVVESGDEVLDLCTGSGHIAVFSASGGAGRVVALDINPAAVDNARANAERHGFADVIDVRESNMFSAVEPGRRFDVITMNPPFLDHPLDDVVSRSTWDEGLHVHRDFFSHAREHLSPRGRMYLAQANFGTVEETEQMARAGGFALRRIGEHRKPYTDIVFSAFELTPA
jgi:release factor glutamine methyltransferase